MTSMYRAQIILALSFLLSSLPMAASAASVSRQPDPYPVGLSTWYGSMYNTTSQHNGILKIGGWGDVYLSQVRFDLSGLPPVATQAIIYLYDFNGGGNPTDIDWYRNSVNWRTSTVSWASTPLSTYAGSTGAPTHNQWYGVDITGIYNQWRSGNASQANYGLALEPDQAGNNNFVHFYGSGHSTAWQRPQIYVTYNPTGTENTPKFKWGIAAPTYANRIVNQPFGVDWSRGIRCPEPNGPIKKHNGTDFAASVGTTVYAPEDGYVKYVFDSLTGDGSAVVMEHTRFNGSKYTTVTWHITPNADTYAQHGGGFIPKGAPLGTVANIASPHYHLGLRMAPYSLDDALSGASPVNNCSKWTAFPAGFVDVNSTANAIF